MKFKSLLDRWRKDAAPALTAQRIRRAAAARRRLPPACAGRAVSRAHASRRSSRTCCMPGSTRSRRRCPTSRARRSFPATIRAIRCTKTSGLTPRFVELTRRFKKSLQADLDAGAARAAAALRCARRWRSRQCSNGNVRVVAHLPEGVGAGRLSLNFTFRYPEPISAYLTVMGFFLGSSKDRAMKPPFDIAADLDTPVSAYLKLAPFRPRFLLESVEGGERLARYSFIGFGDCLEVRLGRIGSYGRRAPHRRGRADRNELLECAARCARRGPATQAGDSRRAAVGRAGRVHRLRRRALFRAPARDAVWMRPRRRMRITWRRARCWCSIT